MQHNLITIQELLDQGAFPDPKDFYCWTLLWLAVGKGHAQVARLPLLHLTDKEGT